MEPPHPPPPTVWFRQRLARHVSEVLRLSWPVIVSRSSLMTMALVDTIMVGHYATRELAYLSIGIMPFMPVFLIMLGMVMGTVVMTSAALGAERFTDCGAAWRRALPYSVLLGVLGLSVSVFGKELLLLSGQTEDLASHGGRIMFILGLGLPAYLLTVTSSLFLEGIKRPKPAMVTMVIANFFNVGLDWVLIYGHLGMPAMGAEGSAITSALLRWIIAATVITYIWNMDDHQKYGVRLSPVGGWRSWAEQRRIGYSSAVSIGGESVSFAIIGLFAGWLGTVPLAAYSITQNLLSMAFMVSLGVGSATVVRVSIARGRSDRADLQLAGWTGLGVNTVFMGLVGLVFVAVPGLLASIYTGDHAVVVIAVSLISFVGVVIVADGGQAVMVNALRGSGGIWSPAAIQSFAYVVVMIPLGWYLGIHRGVGAMGLYQAVLIASLVSLMLLSGRFYWVAHQEMDGGPENG